LHWWRPDAAGGPTPLIRVARDEAWARHSFSLEAASRRPPHTHILYPGISGSAPRGLPSQPRHTPGGGGRAGVSAAAAGPSRLSPPEPRDAAFHIGDFWQLVYGELCEYLGRSGGYVYCQGRIFPPLQSHFSVRGVLGAAHTLCRQLRGQNVTLHLWGWAYLKAMASRKRTPQMEPIKTTAKGYRCPPRHVAGGGAAVCGRPRP